MRSWTSLHRFSIQFAAAGLLAGFAVATLAADLEPYEARVVVARAQVRSGPGEDFYPTAALAKDEMVEVYREHAGGWLAIRPPQDSFSWVFGRHLKLRDDGLAEVEKADVASRIGSRFSDKRNAVQVKLRKGEIVEIVGEETVGGETWYRIAPPSGEFRWIHATNVERAAPIKSVEDEIKEVPVVVPVSTTSESSAEVTESTQTGANVSAPATTDSQQPQSDHWRSAAVGAEVARISPPPLAPLSAAPPTDSAFQQAGPSTESVQVQATSAEPTGPIADDLSRQLTEIELRLSRMVAAPPDRWNTERLERDTEALLAQAQTDAERGAIKATLAKLNQFAAIGRRYQQPPAVSGQPAAESHQPPVAGATPTDNGSVTPDTSKYDAVGILRPVVSKRPGAPQFALVDDRGQVISFVTPTPDLNLQPYLGHRIGVVGTRGFIPEFQRGHVTAGRVSPLNERLVR